MKNFVVVIAVLMVSIINVSAQMKYTPEDGFVWQRVIECDSLSSTDIYNMIKGSGVFKNATQIISDTPEEIVATLQGVESLSNELYSVGKLMSLSFVVQASTCYIGRVMYEIKDGRYRVSLFDISYYIPDNSWHTPTLISRLLCKKDGQLRAIYNKDVEACLNYTFEKQLTPKPRIKDNW